MWHGVIADPLGIQNVQARQQKRFILSHYWARFRRSTFGFERGERDYIEAEAGKRDLHVDAFFPTNALVTRVGPTSCPWAGLQEPVPFSKWQQTVYALQLEGRRWWKQVLTLEQPWGTLIRSRSKGTEPRFSFRAGEISELASLP